MSTAIISLISESTTEVFLSCVLRARKREASTRNAVTSSVKHWILVGWYVWDDKEKTLDKWMNLRNFVEHSQQRWDCVK